MALNDVLKLVALAVVVEIVSRVLVNQSVAKMISDWVYSQIAAFVDSLIPFQIAVSEMLLMVV